MNILSKYKQLLLCATCALPLSTLHAEGVSETEETGNEIKKIEQVKPDWKRLYTNRGMFLFDRGLMGEVPGVYTSFNGFVGNSGMLMLRGVNSINLNATPYIIVDGMPVRYSRNIGSFASGVDHSNLSFINPIDIANVKVVNNGYEGSKYGGRSSNGILVVEMDKGALGAATIDAGVRIGITQGDYSFDVLNPSDYRSYLYSAMLDNGYTTTELQNSPLFDPLNPKYSHNTNWMKQFEQDGMFQDFHFKLKGGDGDTKYLFSIGYGSEQGIIKSMNDQRFNIRLNLDFQLTPKIKIANAFTYNYGTSRFLGQGTHWQTNPLYLAASKAPFMSEYFYSEEGIKVDRLDDVDILGMTNPAAVDGSLQNKGMTNRIDALVRGTMQMTKKSAVNAEIMISYNSLIERLHQKSFGIAQDRYIERQNSKRAYSEYLLRWNAWLEHSERFFRNSGLNLKAGMTLENFKEKMVYGRKVNAASDEMVSVGSGKLADSIGNTKFDHNLMSFYANAALNLGNRLNINGNVSLERSSNFGPNGSWNLYGGAEARLHLIHSNPLQTEVYAQYGRTGNNDVRGGLYARLYRPTVYMNFGGLYLSSIQNDDLKPEYTDNYDAGINFGLAQNRLALSVAYYYRKTFGLLTQKSVPIEIGLDPLYENNGNVINQGVEAAVNLDIIRRANFSWRVYGTLSTLKNEVSNLKNGEVIRTMDKFTGIAKDGEELGSFYGYKVKGIYANSSEVNLLRADGTSYLAGDYIIEDLNKDGKINALDRQIIGSPLPDFYGGFGSEIRIKGFTCSALFTYSYGNDVYNLFRQRMSMMSDFGNQHVDVKDRWISEINTGKGLLPRAAYGDPSDNFATSDRWVEDGSYIKLKSVAVQYDIPMRNRSGFIKGLVVSVNCNNLWCSSSYSGFDPEVYSSADPLLRGVDTGTNPSPRSYIFGLNVSF